MKHFNLFGAAPNPLHSTGMFRSGRFLFILLALVVSAGRLFAAGSEEENAFAVAMDKYHSVPALAEKDFAAFVQKYPNSIRVPEAILRQAESRIYSGNAAGAVDLLATNQVRAGTLAPQYAFWLGRAYEDRDDAKAAATFEDTWRKFPDSQQALDAIVGEADAFARLKNWPGVVRLLLQTNTPFQRAVQQKAKSETMAAGYLVLGDAWLATNDLSRVDQILRDLKPQPLSTDLLWQRDYLASRREQAGGHIDEALKGADNLLGSANVTNRAIGFDFKAGLLEQVTNLDGAIAAYTNNLATDAPLELKQRATLKIAQLEMMQPYGLTNAVQTLARFLVQFPDSPTADRVLLALGEARLKQALSTDTNLTTGETNLFQKALDQLNLLANKFPNSPLLGKAYLDRGWCLWYQGAYADDTKAAELLTNSLAAFSNAAAHLPLSEEQAEARFKWADTQLELGDAAGAITNYSYILKNYALLPAANERHLIERALYQSIRAALDETNLTAASDAVKSILTSYPDSVVGPSALLLTSQELASHQDAVGARKLLVQFEKMYPTNALLPEVHLAIARSFENEGEWEGAITNLSAWAVRFQTNDLLPVAKFELARANDMAGHETNAFLLFTNFIGQFPTDELTARAQYWLGDFYFRQGDNLNAEYNYQLVYKNTNWAGKWSASSDVTNLMLEAQMMAGRAAANRFNFRDAIGYFTNLLNSGCSTNLQVEATIAFADATIARQDSTNKNADLTTAIESLKTVTNTVPGSWQAAQALGKIGDCYFELGARDPDQYAKASEAYRAVLKIPAALADAKYEARYNLGVVIERQAAQKSGDDKTALLKEALGQFCDAFYQSLHDPAKPSPFWTERSGREAGQLAESLQEWQSAYCIYYQLKTLLPVLGPDCDRKMARAGEHGATLEACRFP